MAVEGKLSRYQEAAISALLTEPTIADAAEKAGIGTRTLERWLAESPEFVAEYRTARRRLVEGAIARLQGVSTDAVGALGEIVRDVEAPASVRVRAALGVLDHAVKGIEFLDLEARIAELEDLVGASSGSLPGAGR